MPNHTKEKKARKRKGRGRGKGEGGQLIGQLRWRGGKAGEGRKGREGRKGKRGRGFNVNVCTHVIVSFFIYFLNPSRPTLWGSWVGGTCRGEGKNKL